MSVWAFIEYNDLRFVFKSTIKLDFLGNYALTESWEVGGVGDVRWRNEISPQHVSNLQKLKGTERDAIKSVFRFKISKFKNFVIRMYGVLNIVEK